MEKEKRKRHYYQGFFTPQNPNKYSGDPTKIVYRSGWELRAMKHFDRNPGVLAWSSEEIIVPYVSPKDNRRHKYFPDFVIRVRKKTGEIETIMIEVKPLAQIKEPKKRKRTKRYLEEQITWHVNQAKWAHARAYCEGRGWKFQLMSERELGLAEKS